MHWGRTPRTCTARLLGGLEQVSVVGPMQGAEKLDWDWDQWVVFLCATALSSKTIVSLFVLSVTGATVRSYKMMEE